VIDLSAWDTETDAKEAEAAARRLLARLAGRPEPAAGQPATFADPNGEEWSAERRASRLLCLFGAPAGTREAVSAEVWKSWR
jgi:hypothetical protein